MGEKPNPPAGSILWRDLTVKDADALQRFYCKVVGWRSEMFDGDYNMIPPGESTPVAGVCYARGPNANLPPQWLMYVVVPDLEESVRAAKDEGGQVVDGPRTSGFGRFCVIRDPAGAVIALYETRP
jgi:predicted enzyme related to lactoylglutathione lyase